MGTSRPDFLISLENFVVIVFNPSSTVGEKKRFFKTFLRTFFGWWAVFAGVMQGRVLSFC